MLKNKIFLAISFILFVSACALGKESYNNNILREELLQNLTEISVYIAGYQTHVEDTSTEIVDEAPAAVLMLNCGASCFKDNLDEISKAIDSSRAIKCYPTFFTQKFVLDSNNDVFEFYLDFDGRQIKAGGQCYQLDAEYYFQVDSLGMMTWQTR